MSYFANDRIFEDFTLIYQFIFLVFFENVVILRSTFQ